MEEETITDGKPEGSDTLCLFRFIAPICGTHCSSPQESSACVLSSFGSHLKLQVIWVLWCTKSAYDKSWPENVQNKMQVICPFIPMVKQE